jgi:hypothetical protein
MTVLAGHELRLRPECLVVEHRRTAGVDLGRGGQGLPRRGSLT